jgi:hypothetical protein
MIKIEVKCMHCGFQGSCKDFKLLRSHPSYGSMSICQKCGRSNEIDKFRGAIKYTDIVTIITETKS